MKTTSIDKCYYISTQYAAFAVFVKNGVVINAPPITKWLKGKTIEYVIEYYKKKGAKIESYD